MDPMSYVANLVPVRLLLDTAAGWLFGTEPPREIRGRLIDGARLWRDEDLVEVLPGLTRGGLPASNLQFASLYLVRPDYSAIAFDAASSRRLVRFLASDQGGLDVVVRAGKRLDGTYNLVSVARDDGRVRSMPPRDASIGPGVAAGASLSSTTGRGGARARTRRPTSALNRLRQ